MHFIPLPDMKYNGPTGNQSEVRAGSAHRDTANCSNFLMICISNDTLRDMSACEVSAWSKTLVCL